MGRRKAVHYRRQRRPRLLDLRQCDASALLRAADVACYAAKIAGRGRVEVYRARPEYEASGRFEISKLHQLLG